MPQSQPPSLRKRFQSTPSVGRATVQGRCGGMRGSISIPALRGEGDDPPANAPPKQLYFNPRPPWGGRPALIRCEQINAEFQSTPSVGRATRRRITTAPNITISIHALRGEGDPRRCFIATASTNISIHALRGEGDNSSSYYGRAVKIISIHALRGEGDLANIGNVKVGTYFNPRPPWGGRQRYFL